MLCGSFSYQSLENKRKCSQARTSASQEPSLRLPQREEAGKERRRAGPAETTDPPAPRASPLLTLGRGWMLLITMASQPLLVLTELSGPGPSKHTSASHSTSRGYEDRADHTRELLRKAASWWAPAAHGSASLPPSPETAPRAQRADAPHSTWASLLRLCVSQSGHHLQRRDGHVRRGPCLCHLKKPKQQS